MLLWLSQYTREQDKLETTHWQSEGGNDHGTQKLSKIIMGDENDNERAVWEVSIDDEPEDIIRIITFAGRKLSRSEEIASSSSAALFVVSILFLPCDSSASSRLRCHFFL